MITATCTATAGRPVRALSPRRLPGLRYLFDGDSLKSLADTAAIPQMSDWSGRGNHGTQATAGKRAAAALNQLKGHPVARFNAASSNEYSVSGAGLAITGAFTMFAVFKTTGSAVDAGIFGNGITHHCQLNHHIATTVLGYIHAGGNNAQFAIGSGVWNRVILTWDGTTNANGVKIYNLGTLQGQRTSTSAVSDTANYVIGNETSFWTGDLAMLGIYDRLHSSTALARVNAYLLSKFGV